MSRQRQWARVLHFVPTREAVALCVTSHLLSEAVRLLLRRHVRSWRLVRTASDAAVIRLAEQCPRLTDVNLSSCGNITDAAVIRLAEQCPGLTNVDLSYCGNITYAAVEQLAARYPALRLRRG